MGGEGERERERKIVVAAGWIARPPNVCSGKRVYISLSLFGIPGREAGNSGFDFGMCTMRRKKLLVWALRISIDPVRYFSFLFSPPPL